MIRLKVKEVAQARGMSQARLSRRSDVDIKTLRRIYQDATSANITLGTLNKLAYALRVDARDLIEYERDASLPLPDDREDDEDEG
jgi:transcriptional regulator with XRE-family HTH domain